MESVQPPRASAKKRLATWLLAWRPIPSVLHVLGIYFWSQIVAGACLFVIGLVLMVVQQGGTSWLTTSGLATSNFAQVLFILFVDAYVVYTTIWIARKLNTSWKQKLAIGRGFKISDVAWTILGFAVYFVCFIAITSLVQLLFPSVDINQKQEIGFSDVSGPMLGLVFIGLCVATPIAEELLFRGYLYSGLKNGLSPRVATIVTSVLFGIAHLQFGSSAPLLWIAAIDTFVLSIVLVGLRDKTGALWSSILLHGLKNTVAFYVLFVAKL